MRDKGQVVVRIMRLIDQDIVAAAIPAACPFLIGPAKTERQGDRVILVPLGDRHFQQGLAGKPIEIKTKGAKAILLRQACLLAHDMGIAKVVEA